MLSKASRKVCLLSKVIRFVGDTHGKWLEYLTLIDPSESGIMTSRQLGDMGVGFGIRYSSESIDILLNAMPGDHKFIRGNHDNPDECVLSSHFIEDGCIEDNMMFVGGASSIDRMYRTPGKDWWSDEQLSYEELVEMYYLYENNKPEIMVTHEFPEKFANDVLIPHVGGFNDNSRTRNAFDRMFKFHKPKIWIGAHWHISIDMVYEGTRFIVLPELGYIDIDIESV